MRGEDTFQWAIWTCSPPPLLPQGTQSKTCLICFSLSLPPSVCLSIHLSISPLYTGCRLPATHFTLLPFCFMTGDLTLDWKYKNLYLKLVQNDLCLHHSFFFLYFPDFLCVDKIVYQTVSFNYFSKFWLGGTFIVWICSLEALSLHLFDRPCLQ